MVDEFFNSRLDDYTQRLTDLIEQHNPVDPKTQDMDPEEHEDLINTMLELRSHFRKLQWYSEVNKRGFVKILKKVDKKMHSYIQAPYLNSKILPLPFANTASVNAKLALTNAYIHELSPYVSGAVNHSTTEKIVSSSGIYSSEFSQISVGRIPISAVDTNSTLLLRELVDKNDALGAQKFIQENELSKKILMTFLYKAVSLKSFDCVKVLLNSIDRLEDSSELNGRTILHKLIISHARQQRAGSETNIGPPSFNRTLFLNPAVNPAASANLSTAYGRDGINSNDDVEALVFILNNMRPDQRHALIAVDEYKRTPLHYAAQHGLKQLTQVLIDRMKEWELIDRGNGFDGPEWRNCDGYTPIQLAVFGNHPQTTQAILSSVPLSISNLHDSSNLLYIASKLGSVDLLELLLHHHLNIDYILDTATNETCLYTACKLKYVECVKVLLQHGANTEIAEATYGWTPLFVACVEGHEKICSLLVKAGCDTGKLDDSGWTAMEHACLRGHLKVADVAKPAIMPEVPLLTSDRYASPKENEDLSPPSSGESSPHSRTSSLESVSSMASLMSRNTLQTSLESCSTVKTFGHRHLRDKSMVLVNLGSMDIREMGPPVQLDRVPYSKASSTQLDTTLSLVISSKNCEGEPYTIDLPLPENEPIEQISFNTKNPEDVTLYFDIVPTQYGHKAKIFGRAVALISDHIRKNRHDKMRSLRRTITIPILETSTLEVLGKLQFEYIVVHPFKHPRLDVENSPSYWKSLMSTRVVGHRGLGRNSTSTESLQLGENTLDSFVQAANLGASYVEFDVQLTKDFVPVLYHDYLVSETGIDIPTQAITLEQFLCISDQQHPERASKHRGISPILHAHGEKPAGRRRSLSLHSHTSGQEPSLMEQKMKYTRDIKMKGFKPNIRGHSIQAPVVTLEHAFKTAPKHIGFNIECKYPMLDECENEDMDSFGVEFNFWVDTCKYERLQYPS